MIFPPLAMGLGSNFDNDLMQTSMGALGDGEQDEFKRILLEGNPWFLGLTMAVSMLHSIFDMLAFKNDIGFWKNKKNVEGLSIRTIAINCFCQVFWFPNSLLSLQTFKLCEYTKA